MELSDEALKQMLSDVSHNISIERKKHGISMSCLADMANLSVSHVSKLENAQCEIGLKALIKISVAFGKEAAEFLPSYDKNEETDKKKMRTRAEIFEDLTQGADTRAVEFILKMTAYMVTALDENVSYKKKNSKNVSRRLMKSEV